MTTLETATRNSARNRAYIVGAWAVLMALTTLSWWLGDGAELNVKAAAAVVLVIAFAKALVVGQVFMEQRYAAWALRLVFAAWCVVACGTLLAFYFG
jgi:heme/copper-type cytochrome/quinol oxidase subunit 4